LHADDGGPGDADDDDDDEEDLAGCRVRGIRGSSQAPNRNPSGNKTLVRKITARRTQTIFADIRHADP
jgi:hypothetical protein